MSLTSARPVSEGLFVDAGGEIRLVGSQCDECGVVDVPEPTLVPSLHVTESPREAVGPARDAVVVDDPVLPAEVAAVCGG